MTISFKKDIIVGLSKPQKKLSSKYFYDAKGDEIFQQIMEMEAYYLPQAELDILQKRGLDMIADFPNEQFDVVELGAGDGTKTVYLLDQFCKVNKKIRYFPLDISPDVLETNQSNILKKIPDLTIQPIAGDYFKTLKKLADTTPKVILFLGSNIGNYENEAAVDFLKTVKASMQPGDLLLMGVDLKKHPKIILEAYNDKEGITSQFNLNLLHRINKELGANFDMEAFEHYATYNPLTGIAASFLVSLKKQTVQIGQQTIPFENGETIHTEVSQKYDKAGLEQLQQKAGFSSVTFYNHPQDLFTICKFQ